MWRGETLLTISAKQCSKLSLGVTIKAGARLESFLSCHSLPQPSVQLALQVLDEVLGTLVLTFGETLAYLIYHHARRAVLLQPAE